ncbi:hypothetical protein J2W42_000633 [Rhizobium tibeticum]|nr:hypothetical protein [Rhizobium tibeticum]
MGTTTTRIAVMSFTPAARTIAHGLSLDASYFPLPAAEVAIGPDAWPEALSHRRTSPSVNYLLAWLIGSAVFVDEVSVSVCAFHINV